MERLRELQDEVERGEWRTSEEVLNRIFVEFTDWCDQYGAGVEATSFGTPDFWDSVYKRVPRAEALRSGRTRRNGSQKVWGEGRTTSGSTGGEWKSPRT